MTARATSEVAPGGVVDLLTWLAARTPPALPVPAVPGPPSWAAGRGESRGDGIRIALLDGAVDVSHPDLREARIRRWSPGPGIRDHSGHATACASLLVGQGRRDVLGLTPAAALLAVAVLDAHDGASDERLVRAVRAALAWGADALVLPFGRTRPGRRLALALRAAAERGAPVLAAAGNLGPDVLTFPASVSGVVSVTAWDDGGVLAGCSRRAALAAPGDGVPAAGGAARTALRGSSAAVVLAAGVCALHLADERSQTRDGLGEADEGDQIRDA